VERVDINASGPAKFKRQALVRGVAGEAAGEAKWNPPPQSAFELGK
jgi:hypothetical protein